MKEKPISKAWECITPWEDWNNLNHSPSIVYAETGGKAKYQFNLNCEFEWNYPGGWIFIKVKRSPQNDLHAPRQDKIIDSLSKEQVSIIAHSNGNDGREPGHRDYYHCSSKNKDLLKLVDIGLMIGPQHTESKMIYPGNGYFYLTDEGKKAAFSMLPRKPQQ